MPNTCAAMPARSGFPVKSAVIVTVPTNPEHCALPFISILTPAGICGLPGIPINHCTEIGAVIGAMLKFPVAINCTIPEGNFAASAEDGVTVTLCTKRCCIVMDIPPQETTDIATIDKNGTRRRGVANLRIDTSKTAVKARTSALRPRFALTAMVPLWPSETNFG